MKTALVNKKQILENLHKARAASIEEQNRYREIIKKAFDANNESTVREEFWEGGWASILKVMEDCEFPPLPGGRKDFLHVEMDGELNRLKLQKIEEEEIRYATCFLNEVVEHTQRLRSMAMFYERVGSLCNAGGFLFSIWCMRSRVWIMHAEAIEMGKEEEFKGFKELCDLFEEMADLTLREKIREANSEEIFAIVADFIRNNKPLS